MSVCKLFSSFSSCQINGLGQDCSISIANTLEILQSCAKPSKCLVKYKVWLLATQSLFLHSSRLPTCHGWNYLFLGFYSPIMASWGQAVRAKWDVLIVLMLYESISGAGPMMNGGEIRRTYCGSRYRKVWSLRIELTYQLSKFSFSRSVHVLLSW